MAQWNPKANEIFLGAFELASADERRAYLDTACAGDAARRSAVDNLLHAHDSAGSLLERPAPGADLTMDQCAGGSAREAALLRRAFASRSRGNARNHTPRR